MYRLLSDSLNVVPRSILNDYATKNRRNSINQSIVVYYWHDKMQAKNWPSVSDISALDQHGCRPADSVGCSRRFQLFDCGIIVSCNCFYIVSRETLTCAGVVMFCIRPCRLWYMSINAGWYYWIHCICNLLVFTYSVFIKLHSCLQYWLR